ncbi:MAG: hypothetical protein IJL37_01455 [Bacteroidaceae bacterium]|nr:hypothetical protein [Bacteroidaceae bacterium]
MKAKILFIFLLFLGSFTLYSCLDDEGGSITRAAIMSEDIVKEKMRYPAEVDFEGDRRGSETSTDTYTVYQKFTAKNGFGVKVSYVYKITMKYKGGDWTERSNWDYSNLVIEDVSTGEQVRY